MALKYTFKLTFHKCIFEFMINTAPPTSNSVHGREKCFKYNNCGVTIFQWLRGAAVKDLISLVGDLEGASLNPGEALLLTLYILFSF